MGRAIDFQTVGPCTVGSLLYKGNLVDFVVDTSDVPILKKYSWHYTPNGYLATSLIRDDKKHEVYLHTILLNPKPGEVVEHRTKNGLDNRRANLRVVDEMEAGTTKASKQRSVELPPLCGLAAEDIPKHIWYVQPNGYHRDRFAIELKREGILWKTTSSKKFSLKEKLDQAKEKLKEVYQAYPYLDPKHEEDLRKSLEESFQSILDSVLTK
jgi:hypothetical protein